MKTLRCCGLAVIAPGGLSLLGCTEDQDVSAELDDRAAPGRAPGRDPSVADAPDFLVHSAQQAIAEGDLSLLWDALPASFQSDLKEIVQTLGERVDPELYAGVMGLIAKLAAIMADKREFVLGPAPQPGQESDRLRQELDDTIRLLKLASGEISSADGLKNLDVEEFLSGTLRDALKDSTFLVNLVGDATFQQRFGLAPFMEMTTEIVSHDAGRAVVSIMLPGQPDHPESFVRVEGKWIPETMASSWKPRVNGLLESLDEDERFLGETITAEFMIAIHTVDSALEDLAVATNQAEFDAASVNAHQAFLVGLMNVEWTRVIQVETSIGIEADPLPADLEILSEEDG